MKRKLFLILLVALLAVSLVAVFVACGDSDSNESRDENFLYKEISSEEGDGVNKSGYWVIGYYGDATDIVIPNMHDGKRVIGISSEAFINDSSITSVTISNGVESIGESAFA